MPLLITRLIAIVFVGLGLAGFIFCKTFKLSRLSLSAANLLIHYDVRANVVPFPDYCLFTGNTSFSKSSVARAFAST